MKLYLVVLQETHQPSKTSFDIFYGRIDMDGSALNGDTFGRYEIRKLRGTIPIVIFVE